MPEIRKDPIVHRWVVMAPDRANRPMELTEESDDDSSVDDPFAEGNEQETPGEIAAVRDPSSKVDGPGWQVRVIPNKYPALVSVGQQEDREDGIYASMNGIGRHEVIVECPHNEASLARLSVENVTDVMRIYRDRLVDLKRDPRLAHATIFKNQGVLAGASLRHAHSQLLALPIVPIAIQDELNGAIAYYNNFSRSLFRNLIERELAIGSRVVIDSPRFVVICPYASRFPYEMCILPKQSVSHFENLPEDSIGELAGVLRNCLKKLDVALDNPPYNSVLHTAPFHQPDLPYYSWHFEIFPRTTRVAGFEWGSGYFINTVYPETAAKILREANI